MAAAGLYLQCSVPLVRCAYDGIAEQGRCGRRGGGGGGGGGGWGDSEASRFFLGRALILSNRGNNVKANSDRRVCRFRLSTVTCQSASEASSVLDATDLPLKEIPGDYGFPFFGAIKDRLDWNWFEKPPKFYESRRVKYNSTVFRTNVAPGPPIADSRVVVLLDQKSFPVLFDVTKVEKTDLFMGTYNPSWDFTGGFRTLPFLDPSEEKHALLKAFTFDILQSSSRRLLPEFHKAVLENFAIWESSIEKDGSAVLSIGINEPLYKFLVRSWFGHDPLEGDEVSLKDEGSSLAQIWLVMMLAPIADLSLPQPLQELTIHSFQLPFAFAKKQYTRLYDYFKKHATELLDIAEKKHGLSREEALHNLIYFLNFNSWGGISFLFPSIVAYIAGSSTEFQRELATEVREAVKVNGGLSLRSLADMPLVESTLYEILRIAPPVPYQYARAKVDFILQSHDAAFQIKKGEVLAGYQPLVTKDPRVFSNPTVFDPKRFLGVEGQKLLKHLFWSNGPETESPSVANKQCAGKDYVLMLGRLYICELFLKYDSMGLGSPNEKGQVPLVSLKAATS